MKRFLMFFSLAACAAVMSLTSCKTKQDNNYVDLMLGRWHVDSVFPELPDKKYFVDGDEFVLKADMTMQLDNNWRGYFTSTYWTVAFDFAEKMHYLSMTGIHDEDQYSILLARIVGITEGAMSLEYIDENTSTTYRLTLSRVAD